MMGRALCRCGHCQQLKPVWDKLASSMKGRVGVGAVDCTASQSVCQVLQLPSCLCLLAGRDGAGHPVLVWHRLTICARQCHLPIRSYLPSTASSGLGTSQHLAVPTPEPR